MAFATGKARRAKTRCQSAEATMKLKERPSRACGDKMSKRYTVRYNDRRWEAVKDPTAKPYWENYWHAYAAAIRANEEDWKGFGKWVLLQKGN
jgi:hypothetical protein